MKPALALLLLGASTLAVAAPPPSEKPAINTGGPSPTVDAGTTIVGEEEAAVGLYITPWQDEQPGDLDRPPALHSETADAVDGARLRRDTAAREAIAAYRRPGMHRD